MKLLSEDSLDSCITIVKIRKEDSNYILEFDDDGGSITVGLLQSALDFCKLNNWSFNEIIE